MTMILANQTSRSDNENDDVVVVAICHRLLRNTGAMAPL